MTGALRCLLCLLACCAASRAGAGWADATLGQPIVRTFTAAHIGRPAEAWSSATHPQSGKLYVATSLGPLAFDGSTWTHHDAGHPNETRSLMFGPDGRLWTGSVDQLGWYRINETTGALFYHSLVETIPAEHRPFGIVWGCFANRDRTWFVATGKLFSWDGVAMQVWNFPTSDRLYPVECEGELWFQHAESGLYRATAEGPVLETPSDFLPGIGLVSLRRTPEGLEALTNAGINLIGPTPRQRGDSALLQWLATRRLTSAVNLPDGSRVIASTQGVAITSSEGRLLRVLDGRNGLPANGVTHVLLDRENYLWCSTRHGIFSLAALPAVTLHHPAPERPGSPILALTHDDHNTIWAASEDGIFGFSPHAVDGLSWQLEFKPDDPPTSLHWTGRELIYGVYRGLKSSTASGIRDIATLDTPASPEITPSAFDPDRLHVTYGSFYGQLVRTDQGGWQHHEIANLGFEIESIAEGSEGRLLVGSQDGRIVQLDPATGRIIALYLPTASDAPGSGALSLGRGRHLHALVGQRLFLFRDGTLVPQNEFSPLPAQVAALSLDQRYLYVVFRRPHGSLRAYGLGVVSLSDDGTAINWHELQAPHLDAIGTPDQLMVVPEHSDETLLLSGSAGLLRLRLTELAPWSVPAPPNLGVIFEPVTASPDSLPFASKHISIHLSSPDLHQRPQLLFQVSLSEDGKETWDTPSTIAQHDFSHLREGHYVFSARAVNALGQVSPSTQLTFRVLPPWWRSPWAYASYAALVGTALVGAVQLRERRIRSRNLELEQLVHARTEELVRANAAKDAFLASMSHEIRNPMNGVVGLAATIDIAALDSESRHRFGLLRHCATHLSALLDDILDFSRLQSGAIELHEQPFSPAEMFQSVAAITAAESAASGLPVHTALAPNAPPQLVGDARRIRQVLLNFVSNALKYAGRGTVEITGWTTPLADGRVELTLVVSDEGPGVPLAEQKRIFEKFERGDAARDSRIPGTGMGLAVCRQLADRMKGRVWIESAPDQGSSFYFAVPLAIGPSAVPSTQGPTATPPPSLAALVVDDEEYNRVALGALLVHLGFTVTEAASPSAALAQTQAASFDLICLDYDLPEFQGPDLARKILAAWPATRPRPLLLAATAYSTTEVRQQCLDAGMDGFLGKPVTPERLRVTLREAFAQRFPAPPALPAPPHEPTPDSPLENLRVLARRNQRPLPDETRAFLHQCATEIETLDSALAGHDHAAATRLAHQLAGLLGFVKARDAADAALALEQACRVLAWDEAHAHRRRLGTAWAWHYSALQALTSAPPESTHS